MSDEHPPSKLPEGAVEEAPKCETCKNERIILNPEGGEPISCPDCSDPNDDIQAVIGLSLLATADLSRIWVRLSTHKANGDLIECSSSMALPLVNSCKKIIESKNSDQAIMQVVMEALTNVKYAASDASGKVLTMTYPNLIGMVASSALMNVMQRAKDGVLNAQIARATGVGDGQKITIIGQGGKKPQPKKPNGDGD